MEPILFKDRATGTIHEEKVYFKDAIAFLYGKSWLSKLFGSPVTFLISRYPFFSAMFGWWNKLPITKNKIRPFIERYHVNPEEFLEPIDRFQSFNDFFIRKLKVKARPIAIGKNAAICPADGRYLFYADISQEDGFLVKGQKFCLEDLLQDASLAAKYQQGAMVIVRLCPTDYHRYHFPVDCIPRRTTLINGYLYSVNPIALKQNIHILVQNKRVICKLDSNEFGEVLFLEVGATNVGSINQTYAPSKACCKGEEKGYFSFGASTLILLFEPGRIEFDPDLLEDSRNRIEIFCLMGQSMGRVALQKD
jgi:phosphatidylserine decarboxylase